MSITVNIYYTGHNGNARKFAEEMTSSGAVESIRSTPGNERYEYFMPLGDPETVLLVDRWRDQQAIDEHHGSPVMSTISDLREKYDLHMVVERFVDAPEGPDSDDQFVRS